MRTLLTTLVCGLALWTVAIFAAPLAWGSTSRLTAIGSAVVYATGHVVCHQRPERSFWIGGHPMPVCGRCTGLYLSTLFGTVVALLIGASATAAPRARLLLGAAALPIVLSIVFERTGLVASSNVLRLASALPLGAVTAWVIVGMLRDVPVPHRSS